jgi:hypothetical protein
MKSLLHRLQCIHTKNAIFFSILITSLHIRHRLSVLLLCLCRSCLPSAPPSSGKMGKKKGGTALGAAALRGEKQNVGG